MCIFGGQSMYCCRLIDVLTKRYAHPNPCNLWIYLKQEKRRKEKDQGLCSLQMCLRQEFWDREIILDCPSNSNCNHSVLLKGRQRQIWQKRRQCDHQAEIVLKWSQAKKRLIFIKRGSSNKQILPWSLWGEHDPSGTLILVFWPSELRESIILNFLRFKPPNFWRFITVATESLGVDLRVVGGTQGYAWSLLRAVWGYNGGIRKCLGAVRAIKGKIEVVLGESPEDDSQRFGGIIGSPWKVVWVVQLEKIGKCFVGVLHVELPLGIQGEIGSRTPPCTNTKMQGCTSPLYKMT